MMTEQTSQGAELFKMVKKKRFSIPKIKLPGGGKLKYLFIADADGVFRKAKIEADVYFE
jgi:hypothetical protein